MSNKTNNIRSLKLGQKIALGVGASALVAGLGFGGFYIFTHQEPETIVSADASTSTSDQTPSTAASSTELKNGNNKITSGGTYTFTGEITGKISVDTTDEVIVVLNGVTITGNDGAAIKCQEGSNVTIRLIGENKITSATESDGINSEGDLTVTGEGSLTIKADDDGIHADGKLTVKSGNITITAAEGLEATYIVIDGGTLKITASDDGINAANKSDKYAVKVEMNGGDVTINMGQGDTDAIDSNGDIYINGGTLTITAQSPFDYDGTAKYTGGKMIINGTETTEITNQFANGGGMMGDQQPGQQPSQQSGQQPGQAGRNMMR